MTSRASYYGAGSTASTRSATAAAAIPAGINISTNSGPVAPAAAAFVDLVKQQDQQQQRQQSAMARAYVPGRPAGATEQQQRTHFAPGSGGGDAAHSQGYVDSMEDEEEEREDEEDEEMDVDEEEEEGQTTRDGAAAAALDYGGVRLLPGVEQIDFDEGYYVGTIDETGEMAGYGKATWYTGDAYEGEWMDGMMHGKGTYTWTDGDYYRGDYARGRMEGYGEMKDTTGLYNGEWVGDMRQGYGRMVYAGGNIYEGEWLAGMRHGPGKLIEVAANVTYEGEFNRNEKEGRGVQTNGDGDVYEGEFANGKPNGRGTYLWSDGSRYIGMFKDGVKHGDGCEWLANGDWVAGMFQNGEHIDDQSTKHKATVMIGDEVDGEDADAAAVAMTATAENGRGTVSAAQVQAARTATAPISDEAAASLLVPLDAAQLRRITEPQRPAASPGLSSRRGTLNQGGGSRRSSRMSDLASSPLTAALAAPTVLLEDSELEDWTPLKTIGKGSFGAVCTALLRNGRTVCCKVIELGSVENEEEMEKLRNEIALMKRLHHPNCVQYYGSREDKSKNTLNIFMEFVSGGTLTSFVKKFSAIPLNTLRQWAYQMVCGVKYLHDCGIVHRDIKGDNVLVSIDGIIKLADFGCSKAIDDVCSATHGCSTMVGTPYWMAPEVIKCEAGGYGMKSDIWSIGCTIVEMVTGKPPWPECNSMWAAVYKIANSTGLPTEIPADIDPELMNLLERCFERSPKLRPTAAELLQHPFLAKAAENLPSPNASGSAQNDE